MVGRLSDLRTGRLYPSGSIPGTHFVLRLSRLQDHAAAGRIMSMKNFNRNRYLPTCSSVPQPTALPRVPYLFVVTVINQSAFYISWRVKNFVLPPLSLPPNWYKLSLFCLLKKLDHYAYVLAQTLLNEAEQRNINFIFATYVKTAVVSALNLLRRVFHVNTLINN